MKEPFKIDLLVKFGERAHHTAIEKGWWGENVNPHIATHHGPPLFARRNFDEMMLLATSEMVEAFEEARMPEFEARKIWLGTKDKPEGFPVELADCVIRFLDTLSAARVPLKEAFEYADHYKRAMILRRHLQQRPGDPTKGRSSLPGEQIQEIVRMISETYPEDFSTSGPQIVWEIFDLAEYHNIDLYAAINQKMEYNASRPYRHGGKRA
jgi:NTP pyrophosphatase (non-canonical NTP hydrolase)